ncbi:hypothetical protein MWN34_17960 [Ancylobacter sp. 6x-1]|uniref:Secreted protein n=1 Tax=Ancylobacter crimeensis TaxID=2579147 RepID=A0ABT0DFQ8_9HYPH|nr:hypothetical protein [Ancylobacter crimeensis]MCK0198787.1 hypothetical protein [Ancylobacter crimeensis]
MPPFLIVALGTIGAAALVKLLAKESKRVNAELDETRGTPAPEGDARPTLRRDPQTGDYRPQ